MASPRLSHGIDIVVGIDAAAIPEFVRRFRPPDFYLDEGTVRVAVQRRGMFNLLYLPEADKVDFLMLHDWGAGGRKPCSACACSFPRRKTLFSPSSGGHGSRGGARYISVMPSVSLRSIPRCSMRRT